MSILTTIHTIKSKPLAFIGIVVVLLVLLATTAHADEAEGKVVLIAARGSGIEAMGIRDVRRVYLGLKSVHSESVKKPVINVRSKVLYDEFLKNTMHMTEGSYKRKLVKGMFRQGRGEILELESLKELNAHLLENIGDISFVEKASIEDMQNIEVIQVLW